MSKKKYNHEATLSKAGFVLEKRKRIKRTTSIPIAILNVALLVKRDILLKKIQRARRKNKRISDPQSKVGTIKNVSITKPTKKIISKNVLISTRLLGKKLFAIILKSKL